MLLSILHIGIIDERPDGTINGGVYLAVDCPTSLFAIWLYFFCLILADGITLMQ